MAYGRDGSRNNPFRHNDGSDKPKREVFPTSELPHKWAHQTQSRGRNPQGNLFFDGPTIYSYRRSWPLARIHFKGSQRHAMAALAIGDNYENNKPAEAGLLVLANSDRYSVTTSQHQSAVEQAVSHLPVLRVPNVELFNRALPYERDGMLAAVKASHEENLQHFARIAEKCLAAAERAMREYSFDSSVATARSAVEHAGQYMSFFGIRRKAPTFDNERYAKALERINRILHPDEKTKARHELQRKLRQTKMQEALREQFGAWQSNIASYNARATAYMAERAAAANLTTEQIAQHWRETGEWPRSVERTDLPYPPCCGYKVERKFRNAGFTIPEIVRIPYDGIERPRDVLLRIAGDEIVTSLGARVPIAAAPIVWLLVERALRNGGYTPDRSGLSRVRIGDYPLDRIDADGTLHAGCHTIKYAELERLARALDLEIGLFGYKVQS